MDSVDKSMEYQRDPEHIFAGYFCECGAPLYKRDDGKLFCRKCPNPIPVRKTKASTIEDAQKWGYDTSKHDHVRDLHNAIK